MIDILIFIYYFTLVYELLFTNHSFCVLPLVSLQVFAFSQEDGGGIHPSYLRSSSSCPNLSDEDLSTLAIA